MIYEITPLALFYFWILVNPNVTISKRSKVVTDGIKIQGIA